MRSGPLWTVLAANVVSQLGDMMVAIALPWFVLETTGSVVKMGLAGAAIGTGVILSSLAGGPVVDRLGSKRASVLSDMAAGVAVLVIPLLHLSGRLLFWHFLVLVFLVSVFNAPGDLARRAMIPALAHRADIPLERANAADTAIPRLAQLAGPVLGGVLVAVAGAANVLILDAGTFFVSAALVAVGVRPKAVRGSDDVSSVRDDALDVQLFADTRLRRRLLHRYFYELVEGLRFLRGNKLILSLVVIASVANILERPLMSVVAPAYAESFYQSAASFGAMLAAFGAGALAGTMLFGAIGHRMPRRLTFLIGLLLGPLILFGTLVATPDLPTALVFLALSGVFFGPMNSILATAVQESTSELMLGRVFGTITALSMIGIPLGSVAIGVIVSRAGLVPTLLGMGLIYVALAFVMFGNPAMEQMNAGRPTEN